MSEPTEITHAEPTKEQRETWKPIPGYEGLYEVSSLGRIRSFKYHGHTRTAPKILRTRPCSTGYRGVQLYRPGESRKSRSVHSLVLESFLGPALGRQVNHKNHIKTDNRLDNLEWTTCQENIDHNVKAGRQARGVTQWSCKLTEEAVRAIRSEYKRDVVGFEMLANKYGVTAKAIACIVKRKTWKHVK